MLSFLRRGIVRVLSGAVSAFVLIVAFFKWETTYASIPGDVGEQITALIQLGGTGWLPVVMMFLIGIVLFAVGLGPDRLEAWARWLSRRRVGRREANGEREVET